VLAPDTVAIREVLPAIREHGPIDRGDLRRYVHRSEITIAAATLKLVDAGLVEQVPYAWPLMFEAT
jgi:predicted transcriptional regulator